MHHRFKAAFIALGMMGLSACGSAPVDMAVFNAEVESLVEAEDRYGKMFVLLAEHRPELYLKYRDVAIAAYGQGYSAKDSSFIVGIELRDELLLEAQRLSRVASDEDVRDIIRVTTSRLEYLQKESPADCARHAEGHPLEVVKDFPHELLKAETDLLIQLFEAPQTAENRRAASEKEVLNWTLNVATLEPKVAKLVERLAQEKRGKAAYADICDGTIALNKRLSYRKGETRGTLVRGMALLALQRDQIRRNIAGENGDETA
jgi:hypothetical protein